MGRPTDAPALNGINRGVYPTRCRTLRSRTRPPAPRPVSGQIVITPSAATARTPPPRQRSGLHHCAIARTLYVCAQALVPRSGTVQKHCANPPLGYPGPRGDRGRVRSQRPAFPLALRAVHGVLCEDSVNRSERQLAQRNLPRGFTPRWITCDVSGPGVAAVAHCRGFFRTSASARGFSYRPETGCHAPRHGPLV